MSERDDERISEGPPALPDGAVEVLRWREGGDAHTLKAVDSDGNEWIWGDTALEPKWLLYSYGDRHPGRKALAAELVACRARRDEGDGKAWRLDAESLARLFHETYERLAPQFGYETRTETRAFDPTTPNGRLMVAVCGELLARRATATNATPAGEETTEQ